MVLTFPGVPPFDGTNINNWAISARLTINNLLNGKSNNTDSVTLHTSTSTTTVVLAKGRIGPNSVILFMPRTANAAVEISTGTMYVSTIDSLNNQFMITNAVNTKNDRTFSYIIVG